MGGDCTQRWPLTGRGWPDWTEPLSSALRMQVSQGVSDLRREQQYANRGGHEQLARSCAIRISIYCDWLAEIDQRDQFAREQYQRDYHRWRLDSRYAGKRDGLWADVLRWARTGELPTNWRELLPDYNRRCNALSGEPYRDEVDGLALAEFDALPPQPWEPYVTDWRAALTAWYRDRLTLHAREYQSTTAELSTEPTPFRNPHKEPSTFEVELSAEKACRDADFAAMLSISHRRKRDRIEAWYRAGMAAGGDPEHRGWQQWYRERINTWDRRDDTLYPTLRSAAKALAELDNPTHRAALESLPDYWPH